MEKDKLPKTSIIGTIVAAICCFTPALVVLLGLFGLSSLIGMLDYILLPALFIFLYITVHALWKRQAARSSCIRRSLVRNVGMLRQRRCQQTPVSGSMTAKVAVHF